MLDTLMPTTARGPLMLSQRPMLRLRLTLPSPMEPMDMPDTDTMLDTLMLTTARGPLMLSQRLMLMPTTATTVMAGPTATTVMPGPTATTATMDKFSASEVQSRSSKRTSLLVI